MEGSINFVIMPAGKNVHEISQLALPTYVQLIFDHFDLRARI